MQPLEPKEQRKRKREGIAIIALVTCFVGLTIAEFQLTKHSINLPFVNSIFFFGLLNINIIILVALLWLIFRNIGKVFIERRRDVLGSRLKTKLVASFLSFSIIPTIVLFIISALYINSSFDKWFSLKIQNTLQASLEITRTYYRNTDENATHFAEHIARAVGERLSRSNKWEPGAMPRPMPPWIEAYLNTQRELLAIDAVEFYLDPLDERVISMRPSLAKNAASSHYPPLAWDALERAFKGEPSSITQHIGNGDLIRCLVPVKHPKNAGDVLGVIVVDSYIPVSLINKVDEIASVFDDYKDTNPLKYPIKSTYFVILIMITLVILFVAIWIGLYMARELTVPLERLVQGAKAVGAGNLDVAILASGRDEIAVLVQSFNKMTSDLRENRSRLTEANHDLEKRKMQIEAVLANIEAGVISIDHHRTISTFNKAASRLLLLENSEMLGRLISEALPTEAAPLIELVNAALASPTRTASHTTQWNYRKGDHVLALSAVATALQESDSNWGVVIVIDDMTHLIKGQREVAWREVARRIAHEIKNPLTPIKLSAQRLQRKMSNYRGKEAALLQECTQTIIKHTDELKEMVNEFSSFARFPQSSPTPNDLNEALLEVIKLYQQAHPEIRFVLDLETKIPVFEFDRDQVKRVMINLIDNALSALQSNPGRRIQQIQLNTHYNEQLQMVVIEVLDNGPGMPEEVKARVFEPYFSTKQEGTGLGLAIAKRIINDHDGFIRVQSTPGEGTQFTIELPCTLRQGSERRKSRLGGAFQG